MGVCSIQQSAALALGRLANYSDDLAEAVVQNQVLPQLVGKPHPFMASLSNQQPHWGSHISSKLLQLHRLQGWIRPCGCMQKAVPMKLNMHQCLAQQS